MITGRLQEKNGRYYMVLSLKDQNQKWKPKWVATGLFIKGNKKRAEAMLHDTIKVYEAKASAQGSKEPDGLLFCDFMLNWLELIRNSVEETTFTTYRRIVKTLIVPYFQETGVTLAALQPKHIQAYYSYLMVERKSSATTVRRHHANIRKALQHAVKTDIIASNPADKVEKPKQQPFIAGFYNEDELNLLFEKAKGSRLELPIIVSAFYGLRRSEVLGLKWSAVDFKQKTVTIRHTVSEILDDNGKAHLLQKDRTKNKSSFRTLPLIPQVEELLLRKKAQDQEYMKICRGAYSKKFTDYVFVDELGVLLKPDYLTRGFPHLLEKHGLRKIRLHDLRHSCASLLLKSGVSMKAIQDWLGHSNFSTTANLYAHLDYDSKINTATAIGDALTIHMPNIMLRTSSDAKEFMQNPQ